VGSCTFIEDIRVYRGTITQPGKDSPFRDRVPKENMRLLLSMRRNKDEDVTGKQLTQLSHNRVVRLKINNSHPCMLMRDPIIYRYILQTPGSHNISSDGWYIYPMYDFAQCLCDSFDGVTHSLCTQEFSQNRILYDWVLQKALPSGLLNHVDTVTTEDRKLPKQIEFSRLKFSAGSSVELSKRAIQNLVDKYQMSPSEGSVVKAQAEVNGENAERQSVQKLYTGWDDINLFTIKGLRRRGVSSHILRHFISTIGLSTAADSEIDLYTFDDCARTYLDNSTHRMFCVLDPLPITLTNWDQDSGVEYVSVASHPFNKELSLTRMLPFGKHLIIERSDFSDTRASEKNAVEFYGLVPGGYVRLKGAYLIRCDSVIYDTDTGGNMHVQSLECSVLKNSKGGAWPPEIFGTATTVLNSPTKVKKPKGIIHWLSQPHALRASVTLLHSQVLNKIGRRPARPPPDDQGSTLDAPLDNVNFMEQVKHFGNAFLEPTAEQLCPSVGSVAQFERVGYFCRDSISSSDRSSQNFHCVVPMLQKMKKT
jgi:glutaminyl-tRNA synthetase